MNNFKIQNITRTWPACWQWCQQHAGLHCTHVLFCHDNTCGAFLSGPFLYPRKGHDVRLYNARVTPHDQMWKRQAGFQKKARLNHAAYLDVDDVTLLVDTHVGWQGDRACWVKNTVSSSARAEVHETLFTRKRESNLKPFCVLTMFAEWPAEHVPGTPPLALCVRHYGCLLANSKTKIKVTNKAWLHV